MVTVLREIRLAMDFPAVAGPFNQNAASPRSRPSMSPYSQEFRRLWLGGSRSDWLGRVVFGVLTDARCQTRG